MNSPEINSILDLGWRACAQIAAAQENYTLPRIQHLSLEEQQRLTELCKEFLGHYYATLRLRQREILRSLEADDVDEVVSQIT